MHSILDITYLKVMSRYWFYLPVQVAAPFELWVCGHLLAGIAGSNPTRGMDVCLLWILFVFSEFCVAVWSLVKGSPTECSMFECDSEASMRKRPWPTRGCRAIEKRKLVSFILIDSMTYFVCVCVCVFLVTVGALDCVVSNNNTIGI